MENKKKILIAIVLIIILIIGLTIYVLKNKTNDELDMNIFITQEDDVNKIEPENVGSVDKEDNKETKIAVHITGEVKKTGIVYLEEGARLVDAIEKAGGETKNADLSQVNLAYKLQDGEKIYIPNKKEKINEYIISGNGNNAIKEEENSLNNLKGENKKVNLNTATKSELDSLPGIGPSTAQKIIDYREKNGKFNKVEDLKNIRGIGDAKFSEIKDRITV